jgi:hypothetical protein
MNISNDEVNSEFRADGSDQQAEEGSSMGSGHPEGGRHDAHASQASKTLVLTNLLAITIVLA